MSSRKLLMLVLALMIACGTIIFARHALTPAATQEAEVAAVPAGPEILVAAADLPPGTLLKDKDMKWQVWAGPTKDTMIVKPADKGDYIGALSRAGLKAGEPIIANRVFKASEQGFLSAALAPGMRAISLKVTPVTGLAGLIFPGDHVDVIVAHNVPAPGADKAQNMRERRVSETVVTRARVLALDQKTDEKVTEAKLADVATLEVSPKDAEKIALASDWNATLSLALRGLTEDEIPGETVTAEGIVMPGKPAYTWDSDVSRVLEPPAADPGMARKVQIIRGKDMSEVNFLP